MLWGKKRVSCCGLASKKTKRNKIKNTKKRIATVSTTQLQCWWCVGYNLLLLLMLLVVLVLLRLKMIGLRKKQTNQNCKKNSENDYDC
jgi:hypothetical protein